jgi:hypothetical protein
VNIDTVSLTTSCLSEPSFIFPGWENVPLDGYGDPNEQTVEVILTNNKLGDSDEKS